jgi:hypothetical protein
MRRREFTFGLLLFGAVNPVQAQQHKVHRIAVFHPAEPTPRT